jgi:biotin carboxyl carrier protein
MKMQVAIKAHKDGKIKSIKIKKGGSVAKNGVIAEIE